MNRHAFSQIARRTVAAATLAAAVLGATGMQAESLFHMNRKVADAVVDNRIEVTLKNASPYNRIMRVGGHLYNVNANHEVVFRVPVGTLFAAYTPMQSHAAGSTVLVATDAANHTTLMVD